MKPKIAIACDDVGLDRKEVIKQYLEEEKTA
ncbi:RpiB/LacA/LacB family sugar-phosphate isomerase, partial [Salmonella enterica subsp. enterica serovar Heidelberg]